MRADERHCHHCSAHLGSGGEASDPYDDLKLPPRTYSGTSRAWYEPRDPRTRLAGGPPVAVRGRVATDAWVEDSLEARAQVAEGVTAALLLFRCLLFIALVPDSMIHNRMYGFQSYILHQFAHL